MRTYGPNHNIVVDGSAERHIAPDPDRFETRTLQVLAALDQSEAGHPIVSGIVRIQTRVVTILFGGRIDACGARPLNSAEAAVAGHGSSVEIEFSANPLNALGFPVVGDGGGAAPDELLLHELVHALHMMRGGVARQPITENGFEYLEDLYAILVTNIYSSSLGRRLRRDHLSYSAISESEANTVYSRHYLDIEAMLQEDSGLGFLAFQGLSRVAAGFNPIRDYVEALARGLDLSASEWRRSPFLCRPPRLTAPQDPAASLLRFRGRGRTMVGF